MPSALPFICDLCGVACASQHVLNSHFRGKKHIKRLQGCSATVQCPICEVVVPGGAVSWNVHINGTRHNKLALQKNISAAIQPQGAGATVHGHQFCATCNLYARDDDWEVHLRSKVHQRKIQFAKALAAVEEAARDKHGVTVSHHLGGLNFGVLEVSEAARGEHRVLAITNTVPNSSIVLSDVKLSSSLSRRPSAFTVVFEGPKKVMYGQALQIPISFVHNLRGIYSDRAELYFEDTRLRQKFSIARSFLATVGEQAAFAALQPTAPFVPRKRTARAVEKEVVAGEPPESLNAIPYKGKLPKAEIPDRMLPLFSNKTSVSSMLKQMKELFLPPRLNSVTYGQHYKALLWAEEYRSDQDLQVYDIDSTMLNKYNNLYYLTVPGLAEKRPSVLVGDSIHMQPEHYDADRDKWFQGCVHVVRRDEVGMKFDRSFHAGHTPSRNYRARFKLNRIPLRRQHQALDTAFYPGRLLFPEPRMTTGLTIPRVDALKPIVHNNLIANNTSQLQAIASILALPPGSPLFALFGPPGTGKTVTIVEAIRQILDRNPNARILACAPSNSAADLIASRLAIALNATEMFRFYAPSRFKNSVPDDLVRYSLTNLNGHFTVPPMAILRRYRVIVSTCVSASFAHGVGMPRGHFTHIFFDEAGHATEPEIMIAVKTMADNDTNVVLSGDHKQLGPIIRSAVARGLGLEKSYLERIMDRESHDVTTAHGITVVRLTQNFRSHAEILQFPNERFYDSALQPCGDPRVINLYIGSSLLVNKKFPIVFRALSGQDDREASSPSFFNAMEVLEVKEYVEQLRSSREVRTTDHDIGVITPYHAQCLKIRASLKPFAEGVKVGSVEEFQGQERRVIILSTVRSSREFVVDDLRHSLGFVASPRRLNVAVTRAQSLLIIIGDPAVLGLDPLWRSFLNFIHRNGGWRGDEPSWDTSSLVREDGAYDEEARQAGLQNIDEFARRMERATLANLEEHEEEENNADRPWRELE